MNGQIFPSRTFTRWENFGIKYFFPGRLNIFNWPCLSCGGRAGKVRRGRREDDEMEGGRMEGRTKEEVEKSGERGEEEEKKKEEYKGVQGKNR